MDFSHFDTRNYPTVSTQAGYSEWVQSYEASVEDEMDLRLLNQIKVVDWSQVNDVLDLACGTGRIGLWLMEQGVSKIDGVDFTWNMLHLARQKNIYRHLSLGDVTRLPIDDDAYDVCIQVLADEHIADIAPLYKEAYRITRSDGQFILVGYHPHFLMMGLITHFHRENGDAVGIESYVHLLSHHVTSAMQAGWQLAKMQEGIIDEAWFQKKPKWKKYQNHPVSFCMVWQKN